MNHLGKIEKKDSWIAPFGILLAVVTTLLTSTFKKFIFPAETWTATFFITAIISMIYFIFALKDRFTSATIDDVIEELKKGSPQEDQRIYIKKDEGAISLYEISQNVPTISAPEFQIINGIYGTQDNKVDITDKLQTLTEQGKLATQATNALVGKDPSPGITKFLKIKYKYQDKEYLKMYKENDPVVLP